jgi:signal transduction histidine kinase
VEVAGVERLQESLDRLRLEVTELRASLERVVLAADAERRTIERDLHDGPQQHLVALAANIQRARGLTDTDPAAARVLLDELSRDVLQALDESAKLAHRIYPPLLEAGGLSAALRAAAVSLGVQTRVEVLPSDTEYPQEVAGAVYFCCLDVLQHTGEGARAQIAVRDEDAALAFEVTVDVSSATPVSQALDDRVAALGGRLMIRTTAGGGTQVSGSLPFSR